MRIHFIFFLLLISTLATAQEEAVIATSTDTTSTVPQYLIKKSTIKSVGFFIASEAASTQFGGSFTPIASHSLNLLFNNRFSVGVFGSTQLNRTFTPTDISATNSINLQTNAAGLKLSYSFNPHKLIHFTIPLSAGVGLARVDSIQDVSSNYGRRHHNYRNENANFGFVSSGLEVDVNLFKYGILYFGGQYRFATNVNNNSNVAYKLTTADASGLYVNAGLKLGIFNVWRRKNI